jgi:two-component sensor histidine kinase
LLRAGGALRNRPLVGYGLVLGSCGAAFAVRVALGRVLPPGYPFVSFFPAVIVTTYFAGRAAGLFCTALCALVAWYFFLPPSNSFVLTSGTSLALAFFLFIAGFIALLIGHMHLVTDRLELERARSTRLYEQQRVLFQELQHRVANNMQFVASLLHLQQRQLEKDPSSAVAVISEASRRIEVMARVHRRLYDTSAIEVPIERHLHEICGEIVSASQTGGVTYSVVAEPVTLDIERLMLLSLIITELVTNCLKHAFVGRDMGHVVVQLRNLTSDQLELSVSDNGRGLQSGSSGGRAGLGTRILGGLVSQLRGSLAVESGVGTATRLTFPTYRTDRDSDRTS